ncbi:uncharacterized protein DDB_G0283697-like [Papaver somniferum]|uniref:uncharacterized protein DDB_G0283697-like n=1 Tax=Papaver somniferum TaxID=3469 RepID=UPI000E70337D|nr:uncharacterized protein DDB_G0283697-like [Papaver somniferum]
MELDIQWFFGDDELGDENQWKKPEHSRELFDAIMTEKMDHAAVNTMVVKIIARDERKQQERDEKNESRVWIKRSSAAESDFEEKEKEEEEEVESDNEKMREKAKRKKDARCERYLAENANSSIFARTMRERLDGESDSEKAEENTGDVVKDKDEMEEDGEDCENASDGYGTSVSSGSEDSEEVEEERFSTSGEDYSK